MKTCIACGMPMTKPEDYPNVDESKDYCRYCARPDGTMQSYDGKLQSMTAFLVRTQGLDETAACSVAQRSMAKLPAWRGQAH